MFDDLIAAYHAYLETMATKPYDRDAVQGKGMYFAKLWNAHKAEICAVAGIEPEDFSYGKWRFVMETL